MTTALHAEPASTPAPLALSAKAKSTPSTPISAFPAAPAQILAPAVLSPRDKFPPNVTTHTKKRETACRSLSLFWINLPLIFQAVFGFTRETLCQMWKTGINPLRLMQKMPLMDHWCCLLNLVGKDAVCRAHYPSLLKKSFWKKPTFPTPGKENTNKTKPFPV